MDCITEKPTSLAGFYFRAEEQLLSRCVCCGKCVTECRILKQTMEPMDGRNIQNDILSFLRGEADLSLESKRKLDACMRCYGCMDVACPAGVDSLTINEIVWLKRSEIKQVPPLQELFKEHLRTLQAECSEEEMRLLTTTRITEGAEVVFFSGCNVMKTPRLLLNALEILDHVGRPYSYLAGMEYCCGGGLWGEHQDVDWMEHKGCQLLRAAVKSGARQLVCWCPTCCVYIKERIATIRECEIECIPLPEYLRQAGASLEAAAEEKIAVHEPCKAAYRGIPTESLERMLADVPGLDVVRMEHHGRNTMCCGCRATGTLPELGDQISAARIREAQAAGADRLLTICHFCQTVLEKYSRKNDIPSPIVENYSDYLRKMISKKA